MSVPPTTNPRTARATGLLVPIGLAVAVFGCAIYANLSFAVKRPANYRWFPPFDRNTNANANRHLGAEYFNIARSLVRGQGYSNPFRDPTGPTAWMPPVFPFLLAGLLWASDDDRDAVMVVVVFLQTCVLAGTGLMVLALARPKTRLGAAIAAGVFFVFLLSNFHLCFQSTHDCWIVMLALDLVLAGLCWWRPLDGRKAAAGWGLVGGFCAQVSPIVGFTWGMSSLVLAWRQRAWSRFGVAVLAAGLALAPWTIRNYVVLGRLVPVKSNAAYELYQSQCLQPDGLLHWSTFRTHPYGSASQERQQYAALGEMVFLDRKRDQFWQAVAADPLDFLDRVACRFLGATLWYEPMNPVWEGRHPWSLWYSRLTFPLPFLGLLILALSAARKSLHPFQWAGIGVYLFYLLPYIAVSYYDRYAVPLLGVKVLLVLWAADRLLTLAFGQRAQAGGRNPQRRADDDTPRPRRVRVSRPAPRTCRQAFTLIELLIVIAILGTLLALLLPAIQQARASAVRIRCSGNLRQLGMALHQFHDNNQVFPSNGGWDGKQTIPSVAGSPFTPWTLDYATGQTYQWGVGDPLLSARNQTGSWAFSLLPYIEQGSMYSQRSWTSGVSLYICPARRPPTAEPVVAADAYGQYDGGGWTWGKTDYAANQLIFEQRPECHNMQSIGDGLSNTLFLGEKAFNPQVEQAQSWYWDEPFFLGGSRGTTRGGLALLRDGPDTPFKENWGSAHSDGVLFLVGDGSVHLLARTTDEGILAALLTPDGGEAVSVP